VIHQVLQMDSDERVMATIERSKIGLVPIIFFAFFIIIVTFIGLFMTGNYRSEVAEVIPLPMVILVIVAVATLLEIFTYIAFIIYIRNKLIVTNESIIQHLQRGLFHRHISQLSVGNVEDVTVNQNGILAHFFNYGTIIIETAGEQSNFVFPLAKNPYEAAKVVIECHESYLKIRPEAVNNA
jgi:hypothetical protein